MQGQLLSTHLIVPGCFLPHWTDGKIDSVGLTNSPALVILRADALSSGEGERGPRYPIWKSQ